MTVAGVLGRSTRTTAEPANKHSCFGCATHVEVTVDVLCKYKGERN